MERKPDYIFNSDVDNRKVFQLATGYISETAILFEKEGIVAVIGAEGKLEIFNTSDKLIASEKLPGIDAGKGKYLEVECSSPDNTVTLSFPTYEWIDNYPHCDGEHDRWDTRRTGEITVSFDSSSDKILIG